MLCCNTARYNRLQRCFAPSMQLYLPHHKTAFRALQVLFRRLYPLSRPRYQTDTSGYNTICATLERLPMPGRAQPIPDTTTTPGRYTGQRSRHIIIGYIRVQHTADHDSPAGSSPTVCGSLASATPGAPAEGSVSPPVQGQPGGLQSGTGQRSWCTGWQPPPGGAAQRQERGGRRGTIGGLRRTSFGLAPDS